MLDEDSNEIANFWRFASQDPKLWQLDGNGFWPILLMLFPPHEFTFWIGLTTIAALFVLRHFGYGAQAAGRRIVRFIVGNLRPRGKG